MQKKSHFCWGIAMLLVLCVLVPATASGEALNTKPSSRSAFTGHRTSTPGTTSRKIVTSPEQLMGRGFCHLCRTSRLSRLDSLALPSLEAKTEDFGLGEAVLVRMPSSTSCFVPGFPSVQPPRTPKSAPGIKCQLEALTFNRSKIASISMCYT